MGGDGSPWRTGQGKGPPRGSEVAKPGRSWVMGTVVQACGYRVDMGPMDLDFKGTGVGGPHPVKAVIRQALRGLVPVELTVQDHVFHFMDLDYALWG